MNKVVIGIVTKYRDGDENNKLFDVRVRAEVKQAIFDNGAIAIGIISPNKDIQGVGDNWFKYNDLIDKENIILQINMCDGIILQGGNANEAYEPFVAKYCYDNDIPCLGICAGQNSMVRGLGGTTYRIPNPEKHMRYDTDYVHSISIDKSSKFYEIIKKESIMVNSRHQRSVESCPNLDKVGFSEEGYAEVVEAKDKAFFIGVRFHPESLYEIDENMNKIFEAFIENCKNNKDT